jgi:hypothetical protein
MFDSNDQGTGIWENAYIDFSNYLWVLVRWFLSLVKARVLCLKHIISDLIM